METLELKKQNAVKAYDQADAAGKKLLIALYPDLIPQKITDRVKTFDDILEISGIKMADLAQGCRDENELANRKAQLIAQVYNEGTVLDPMNTAEYKYFPWFEIVPKSGFGLSSDGYDYWHSVTFVGVRLCFKSADLAKDAGQKFTEIYATLLIK